MIPDDTIAAPASPPGPGLRAIVRVSGSHAAEVVARCFQPDDPQRWTSRSIAERHPGVFDAAGIETPLPGAVYLWPTARSYTGQPMAELHFLGSPPLVDAVLESLYAAGARPAQAGEFTLRAFLSARLDLVQAEAVLGVIDAGDDAQLRRALSQLAGGISNGIAEVREGLLLHLADLEAGLDFVEEDIEFVSRDALLNRLDEAIALLDRLTRQTASRMHSTGRRTVVLAGLPNAGKSTLFNALVNEEAAIVSSQKGTTRDLLSAAVEWDGLAIDLVDTAGWEESAEAILGEAERMRNDRLAYAELIVWCTAADLAPQERILDDFRRNRLPQRVPQFRIITRCDLAADETSAGEIRISGRSGEGLDRLRDEIAARLREGELHEGELLGSTAARCRESLRGAHAALQRAREATARGLGDEVVALDMRAGLDDLGRVCGAVFTDDILDRIFSRFCIGK
jgi:tRNA modification GTPase